MFEDSQQMIPMQIALHARGVVVDAERQIGGELIGIVVKAEPFDEVGDPPAAICERQVKQAGVQVEILADREFGIK